MEAERSIFAFFVSVVGFGKAFFFSFLPGMILEGRITGRTHTKITSFFDVNPPPYEAQSLWFSVHVCVIISLSVCVVAVFCRAVSTFWIANPNNNLISNAAAGSQVVT